MKFNVVSRKEASISIDRTEEQEQLLRAIKKLKTGGKALKVTFKDETELSALRNVVYRYNQRQSDTIRSSRAHEHNVVFFFKP